MSQTGWFCGPGEKKGEGVEKKEVQKYHCKPPRREDVAPVVEHGSMTDKEEDGNNHDDGACVDEKSLAPQDGRLPF